MSCLVQTKSGAAQGSLENGVCVWRGIPYARPPVGDLRFLPAQPAEPWEGVKDAADFGPMCPQARQMEARYGQWARMDEDCLTLNVWAPEKAEGCPVLFFIHGGSFCEGSGADPEYDGTNLVEAGGVIVVTVNYRLGALGFLDFSFLDERFSANCGLTDIVEALRWVYENISAFGGDAANITVMGQSAGGTCACVLPCLPQARPHISKVIMMSGGPTLLQDSGQNRKIARRFLDFMGIEDAETLCKTPAMKLAARQKEFAQKSGMGAGAFSLAADGAVVPQHPIPAAAGGRIKDIPFLIGTTREEMSFVFIKHLAHIIDISGVRKAGANGEAPEAKERIAAAYKRYGRRGPAILISDLVFRIPSVWFAEACSAHTDIWMYRFDYETFGMRISTLHAFHSSDVPFVFGNFRAGLARYMLLLSPVKKWAMRVYREVQRDFLEFAKNGNLSWPKCEGRNTPAKCYDIKPFVEPAVHPEVRQAYDDSEFERRSFGGESNNLKT